MRPNQYWDLLPVFSYGIGKRFAVCGAFIQAVSNEGRINQRRIEFNNIGSSKEPLFECLGCIYVGRNPF